MEKKCFLSEFQQSKVEIISLPTAKTKAIETNDAAN